MPGHRRTQRGVPREGLGAARPGRTRVPALRLITFEMHESRHDALGPEGLLDQLSRIRTASPLAVPRVA